MTKEITIICDEILSMEKQMNELNIEIATRRVKLNGLCAPDSRVLKDVVNYLGDNR